MFADAFTIALLEDAYTNVPLFEAVKAPVNVDVPICANVELFVMAVFEFVIPALDVINPVDVKVPVCVVVEGEEKFPIANVVEVGSKDVILKAGQVKIFDNWIELVVKRPPIEEVGLKVILTLFNIP